jgi:hypothetical protein
LSSPLWRKEDSAKKSSPQPQAAANCRRDDEAPSSGLPPLRVSKCRSVHNGVSTI